jgi:hypothetical protein
MQILDRVGGFRRHKFFMELAWDNSKTSLMLFLQKQQRAYGASNFLDYKVVSYTWICSSVAHGLAAHAGRMAPGGSMFWHHGTLLSKLCWTVI